MNFVFENIYPRNVSFFDFKLHCEDGFSNSHRHKAIGLSERLGRKRAPNNFAPVFRQTLEIGHLRVRANIIAFDLGKVLHFIHLDNGRAVRACSNSIIQRSGCYE